MYHFEKFEKQNLEKVFRVQAEVFSFVAVQMQMMLQLMHHIQTALIIRLLKLSLPLLVMTKSFFHTVFFCFLKNQYLG